MRGVEEIIMELCQHPDCLHIEAYTKGDILSKVQVECARELNVHPSDIGFKTTDLSDGEWEDIAGQIDCWHLGAYEQSFSGPWELSEEVYQRLTRQIKLKTLLKNKIQ